MSMSKFLSECFFCNSQKLVVGSRSPAITIRHKSGNKGEGQKRSGGRKVPKALIIEQCRSDIKLRQSEAKFGLPSLQPKDCERRLIFAKTLLPLIDKEPELLNSILFSDEGNFWPEASEVIVGGAKGDGVSLNKKRYKWKKMYAESKPLPTICWCGMTSKEIVGPYFFNSHVTERSYLKMLQKFLLPQLKLRNIPISTVWFQQDGAPPHRSSKVLEYLAKTFDTRLISYGMPIAWPPKSQDLTPLDYFLWDHLKTKMKIYSPTTHENLRECLTFELENIEPEILQHFVNEFRTRLVKCIQAEGHRFDVEPSMTYPFPPEP